MYPKIDEIRAIPNIRDYKRVSVAMEFLSDFITPIEAMRILKSHSTHTFLLESVEDRKQWGRWSFLGFKPKLEITARGECVYLNGAESPAHKGNPNALIREILREYKSPKIDELPPFCGGLVGYFSYSYLRYSEAKVDKMFADSANRVKNAESSAESAPFNDIDLMLFDSLIAFDNLRQKIVLITNIALNDLENAYNKAQINLKSLQDILTKRTPLGAIPQPSPLNLTSKFTPDFTQDAFCAMVERAKGYIKEGDIFQVVLSNPLRAHAKGSLFDTYRILRSTNPSPYMFYFSSDCIEMAGASPETLVKLQNETLYTYPLAGSRPRGANEREDEALERELLSDEKECAEHNMLVDLGRNDIGKVAKIGSVAVEKYMQVVRYSHIMHIASCVKGEICDDLDALDAISAVLPAGTLVGAPKIRACEIINELEKSPRGVYGGAIGYLDFSGNMDSCIAIRLVYKKGDELVVRSGAGIVSDSVAENEHTECLNKAKAVLNAINQANGGI
ncbi:anthranilate synthase component I family protein [Helicobacter sp. 23-1045]